MDKETKISEIEVNVKIPLEPKVANVSKILKLNGLSSISGGVYSSEQHEAVNKFLEDYYKAMIEPVKTFDNVVFQEDKKVIVLWDSAYIQVVKDSNENSWMWESLDLDHYFMLSDIETKGIIEVLRETLREMARQHNEIMINYYYFCLKHGLKPEFSGYSGDNEDLLKEKLEERIRSDIDAQTDQYYREGFEDDYISDKFDSAIHKEEYLYDLLEEAREKYENSDEQQGDIKQATDDVIAKWLSYSNDPITKEVTDKIRGVE